MSKILNFIGLSLYRDTKILKEENAKLNNELHAVVKFNTNKLQRWGKKVKKVGKCDCCNTTKNLEAHHLWSKAEHPSLAYQKDNGVPLCTDCHFRFHKEFPDNEFLSPRKYEIFRKIQKGKQAQKEYMVLMQNIENELKLRDKND